MKKNKNLAICFLLIILSNFPFSNTFSICKCHRKANNAAIQKELGNFLLLHKRDLNTYLNSYKRGCKIDLENTVFILDSKNLKEVFLRTPIYRGKRHLIIGEIVSDIILEESYSKLDLINIFSCKEDLTLKFHIASDYPFIVLNSFPKLIYENILNLDIKKTHDKTIIYIEKSGYSNPKKSYVIIQETYDGRLIKKLFC